VVEVAEVAEVAELIAEVIEAEDLMEQPAATRNNGSRLTIILS